MTDHRLLSDADLTAARPVTPAELEAACAKVMAMSDVEFVLACAKVGRQVHFDLDGFADFLAGKLP